MSTREKLSLERYFRELKRLDPIRAEGTVTKVVGLLIESEGPPAALGDFCEILAGDGNVVRVQVIGFRDGRVLSMPLEETGGLRLGDKIVARPQAARVKVGPQLLGTGSERTWDTDGWRPVH